MKIYSIVLVAFILIGLGCVSQSNTPTPTPPIINNTTPSSSGTGTVDDGTGNNNEGNNPTIMEVDLKNIEFDPSTISLSVGQTIHFVNQDGFAHDVHITKDGADYFPRVQVNAGSTVDVEITEAGSYTLICDRHAPGMSGTIEAH